jgi:predicted MFS family arabinose efflux permease
MGKNFDMTDRSQPAHLAQPEQPAKFNPAYAYFVAGLLAVVYTFNFLDRQVLSILQELIKKELNLSDSQLGKLAGLNFAVVYTTLGLPVAWLADRGNRVRIIAIACAIWSVCTVATGKATSYLQLVLLRMGVATGEAGGSPPSYSLIADYFPPAKRGTALAIYSLGVPFGMLLGSAAGAWVAEHYGWRMAFVAVGTPGILMAVVLWLAIREPKRGQMDAFAAGQTKHAETPSILDAIKAYIKNRTLLLTALSSGSSSFVGYAMLAWGPSFLIRVKGMSQLEIAMYYSFVSGIAMAFGTFGSGWLVDRWSRRNRRAYALVPAIAFLVTIPFFVGMIYAPSWQLALACLAVPSLLNNMYLAPAITVVQNEVSPSQRTMASAILLFVLNLIGLGFGPWYVGALSDHLLPEFGKDSLRYAMLGLLPFIVLTVFSHVAASRSIKRD